MAKKRENAPCDAPGLELRFQGGFYELVSPVLPSIRGMYWFIDTQINCPEFTQNPDAYWSLLAETERPWPASLSLPLFRPELLENYGP